MSRWPTTLPPAARPRVEHWGDALGHGKVAGRDAGRADGHAGTRCPVSGRRSARTRSSTPRGGTGLTMPGSSSTPTGPSRSGTRATASTVGVLTHECDADYERGGAADRARERRCRDTVTIRYAGAALPCGARTRACARSSSCRPATSRSVIGACLLALADQRDIEPRHLRGRSSFSTTATTTRAGARSSRRSGHPRLRLNVLELELLRGVGHARRIGMDLACERLLAVGRPDGLIATTDADSVVAGDWLAVQLELAIAARARSEGASSSTPPRPARLSPGRAQRRAPRRIARLGQVRDAGHTGAISSPSTTSSAAPRSR